MGPFGAFLYAMQAAGLVSSIFSAHSKQRTIQLGRQLEKEQLGYNLQAVRLQSAEGSLDEMKLVRQNIGSQIAANAARGNRANVAGINETTRNFETDERKRRMNLLAKESDLRANNILSGLHLNDSETELGQQLTKDILNTIPTTSLFSQSRKSSSNNATANSGGSFNWGY